LIVRTKRTFCTSDGHFPIDKSPWNSEALQRDTHSIIEFNIYRALAPISADSEKVALSDFWETPSVYPYSTDSLRFSYDDSSWTWMWFLQVQNFDRNKSLLWWRWWSSGSIIMQEMCWRA